MRGCHKPGSPDQLYYKLSDRHSISSTHEPSILLVRHSALLPPNLPTEGEAFVPCWRVVKNFDNYSMQRKIRETNCRFLQFGVAARKPG